MRLLRIPVLVAALVLSANSASAADSFSVLKDPSVHDTRPQTIDVAVILGFIFGSYNHYGVGAWYGFPILPDGFIPSLNDALYIEAGAAIERYHWTFGNACKESWTRFTPMGGGRYQMYLTQDWTAFATAKIGFGFGFNDSIDCLGSTAGSASNSQLVGDVSLGAFWNFSRTWHARFEIGYFGITPGIGTQF